MKCILENFSIGTMVNGKDLGIHGWLDDGKCTVMFQWAAKNDRLIRPLVTEAGEAVIMPQGEGFEGKIHLDVDITTVERQVRETFAPLVSGSRTSWWFRPVTDATTEEQGCKLVLEVESPRVVYVTGWEAELEPQQLEAYSRLLTAMQIATTVSVLFNSPLRWHARITLTDEAAATPLYTYTRLADLMPVD